MVSIAVVAASMARAGAEAPLPEPLTALDGSKITTVEQWRTKRRPELLELFAKQMYGHSPERPEKMKIEVFDRDPHALADKATRIQIALYPGGDPGGPRMDLLIYVPNQVKGPVPAILALNFWGNQSVHPDPGIRITESWVEEKTSYVNLAAVRDHRATEDSRGINAKQWPVEHILARGYAFATLYREDIAPDHEPYFASGAQSLYPELQQREDNFGSIAAWAWGLSRGMDALEKEPLIDAKRVAVMGWSRLGKAALWAGATDERFAAVYCHESGAGGAKLFHRGVGENIERLNRVFPHWFARSFRQYVGKDTELPFDQHLVISLVAPRPVYVASAIDDKNADPEGEFAGAKAAEPVYKLLGAGGLPAETWPAVGQPVLNGTIGYHVRPGGHDLTDYDWEQYLDFSDRHLKDH
ncbi:MAG: acetylxylan esterase [Luteolibacter sp.]